MVVHLLALTFAFICDAFIGDPPNWPHPVKWIGSGIAFLEKRFNKGFNRKIKGMGMVLIVVSVVFILTFTILWFSYQLHFLFGFFLESILISTTIARRSLKEAGLHVYQPLSEGHMDEARLKLSYIVGRDTEKLDEGEIVRGTVETIAENTSDGVTAPLFWALIGGAPLAFVYRAINTCDSMVGYKNEKYLAFGWASAKLDDLVNWIPSRITGFVMLIGNRSLEMSAKEAWSIFFRDARKHPSPNSGWLEAAVAALLGVQLGGLNYYKGMVSDRAKMGDKKVPLQKEHILKTNQILMKTSILFIFALWMGGILIELAATWLKSTLYI